MKSEIAIDLALNALQLAAVALRCPLDIDAIHDSLLDATENVRKLTEKDKEANK